MCQHLLEDAAAVLRTIPEEVRKGLGEGWDSLGTVSWQSGDKVTVQSSCAQKDVLPDALV